MAFTLMNLPFSKNELVPYISSETIEFHYGKHHLTYVENLNKLIYNTKFDDCSLIEIIKTSNGPIFNNAAQLWNHDFYWMSVKNNLQQNISAELISAINTMFGNIENFKKRFIELSMSVFGSGWVWLVKEKGGLNIVATNNANSPLINDNQIPIFTCDVWEHAYYIDYRNSRLQYLESFWNIINWEFANKNFIKSL